MNDNEAPQSSLEAIELLTFLVAGEYCASDISATREFRSWTVPSSLPGVPDHVLGVTNLRGVVLPLLDLAACLVLAAQQESERSVIIVVESDDTPIGLLVDAVSDIVSPTKDELQPPPDTATGGDQSHVQAPTIIGEKMVRVLDLASVLPTIADAA